MTKSVHVPGNLTPVLGEDHFVDGRCFQGSRGGIEAGKLEYVRS